MPYITRVIGDVPALYIWWTVHTAMLSRQSTGEADLSSPIMWHIDLISAPLLVRGRESAGVDHACFHNQPQWRSPPNISLAVCLFTHLHPPLVCPYRRCCMRRCRSFAVDRSHTWTSDS